MDIVKLKDILVTKNIFITENSKNYQCRCLYCGDHSDPKKHGHLWVSKKENMPMAHCFLCNKAVTINTLIRDLTSDKKLAESVISLEEIKNSAKIKHKKTGSRNLRYYNIPDINNTSFDYKKFYIKKRIGNHQIDLDNIIYNFQEFITINNLDIVGENKLLSNMEFDYLQKNFIGFMSANNTVIYCRNIDTKSSYKFKKIKLQDDPFELLDYWQIKGNNPLSNKIVVAEGTFDIMGEYYNDTLGLRDDVLLYASGGSFSYEALIKSICFNEDLFKTDIIILSDKDKEKYFYYKMLNNNKHLIKTNKIFVNTQGKDFGKLPIRPIRL